MWREGRPYALHCDRYTEVRYNMRALTVVLKAMREIAKHGEPELLRRTMIGFCREIAAGGRP